MWTRVKHLLLMKLKMINDECITPVVKRQEKTKNGIHRVMHFLGKNPKISIRLSHLHFQCLFFNMFKLYIPLYHRQQCAYGLVRFRHKIHLVSVENNVLAQNTRFGRHRRDCNTVLRSHQKYPVVSHKQMFEHSLEPWSLAVGSWWAKQWLTGTFTASILFWRLGSTAGSSCRHLSTASPWFCLFPSFLHLYLFLFPQEFDAFFFCSIAFDNRSLGITALWPRCEGLIAIWTLDRRGLNGIRKRFSGGDGTPEKPWHHLWRRTRREKCMYN